MEIVVRTPHGDADVSIVGHDPTDTLGDVIRAVTGQAVPRLALVDGHGVDCATPVDDVGLLIGSVVTTEPTLPDPTAAGDVDLLQIAGHGAGRVVHLGPGRYRIGPGRRTTAAELDQAPVERAEVELVVEPTADATVVPVGSDVALDGTAITAPSSWSDETLVVGSRAFLLDPSSDRGQAPGRARTPLSTTARRIVGAQGTITFSRPPRDRSEPARRPVVDAVRTSTTTAPTLWERRSDHADAFSLPFGVRADVSGVTTATIDVAGERAVAISGSERFRSALARTLMVEAVTLHGPSDLDVVVLTSSDDVAEWDWVKWLPHARLDGPPAIWCSDHDIARWGERAGAATALADAAWSPSHLTMVVLDDPALWTRRDSPIRAVVANPPDHLRLFALCDDVREAPSICTAAISESADGLACLHSFNKDVDIDGIRPSLTETAVALRVARPIAALVDVDLPTAPAGSDEPDETIGLPDVIGVTDVEELLARWNADRPVTTVTVGRRDLQGVEVSATDAVTVVVGSTMGDAFDVAATSILAQCAHRSPDGLWVVPLMMVDTPRSEVLWQLPHATQRESATSPLDAGRLLARLRAVLDDPSGPDRILVVAEHSGHSPASLDEPLLRALVDGARSTPGLGVMVITDRAGGPVPEADTLIRVERQVWSDTDGRRRRAATVTGDGSTSAPFHPFDPSPLPSPALELRPYVIGRPLTPLERRVEHEHARASSAPDPAIEQFVSWLQDAAPTWERTSRANERPGGVTPRPIRRVVPPAMPTRVDLDELFRTSPGDGVPLGLVDDPETGGLRPRWWQPGDGSMLVFGSRRSGVEQVLSTVVLGVIDRFAPDDVHLVVIDPSPARRRALNVVGHGLHVVAPDQVGELNGALDEIEAALGRQAEAAAERRADGPRLVVVISDLAQLRQQGADAALTTRLDAVLDAAVASDAGVDVIAYAGDLAGVGPFATAAQHRVVGITSERAELAALGVDDASDLEGIVGRCRSFPGGDLMQLAMPDAVIETMLARRSEGGPA